MEKVLIDLGRWYDDMNPRRHDDDDGEDDNDNEDDQDDDNSDNYLCICVIYHDTCDLLFTMYYNYDLSIYHPQCKLPALSFPYGV